VFGVNNLECREAHVAFETDALHEPALLDAAIHEIHNKLRIPSKHAELVVVYKEFHVQHVSVSTQLSVAATLLLLPRAWTHDLDGPLGLNEVTY
jgi:hypothetical protein